MRRVQVNGLLTLMDFCTGPSFASGGFIADSQFTGATVINGSQQQWVVRNSTLDGWTNGVWNQVFSGVIGAPAQCFPAQASCGPYTTLATSPVTREAPFLYVDTGGRYRVFVPAVQRNSSGTTWANGPASGRSIDIEDVFIARPSDDDRAINTALSRGKHLLFTPGVYAVDKTIALKRDNTIVLGLGFPTLVPQNGVVPMSVADVSGVGISGLLFDAGAVNSPTLLRVGSRELDDGDGAQAEDAAANPTLLSDVFFRIGGATPGKATTSLVVNSPNVVLDDIWAWRADHGNGVGWTANTADTGVIVNGDNVLATGLFVEHFQKYNVIWNGERGRTVMFQNELPYDPPDQAAYGHGGVAGWAAYKVADSVRGHEGWGLGSYCYFNVDPTIHNAHSFEVPDRPGVKFHDLLTVSLNGAGVIDHVINDFGDAAQGTATVPVDIVSYPPA
jgi:hypothetical protein